MGGTPPPFRDIPPKNFLQKVLKMVFFAQKTPLRTKFSAKRELRIWGVPPPPFTDKIRKVVFEVPPNAQSHPSRQAFVAGIPGILKKISSVKM